MSIIFSDDFATGTEPDPTNWLESIGDIDVVSGVLRAITADVSGLTLVQTTTAAHAPIADCKVTVTQISITGDGAPCARVISTDVTPQMYGSVKYPSPNNLETVRWDNSTSSTSLQSTSVTQTANGIIAIAVTGTGATVTIKAYYNGVQIGANISDTSGSRITSAGQTGVAFGRVGATDGNYDNFNVDNLVVDNIYSIQNAILLQAVITGAYF